MLHALGYIFIGCLTFNLIASALLAITFKWEDVKTIKEQKKLMLEEAGKEKELNDTADYVRIITDNILSILKICNLVSVSYVPELHSCSELAELGYKTIMEEITNDLNKKYPDIHFDERMSRRYLHEYRECYVHYSSIVFNGYKFVITKKEALISNRILSMAEISNSAMEAHKNVKEYYIQELRNRSMNKQHQQLINDIDKMQEEAEKIKPKRTEKPKRPPEKNLFVKGVHSGVFILPDPMETYISRYGNKTIEQQLQEYYETTMNGKVPNNITERSMKIASSNLKRILLLYKEFNFDIELKHDDLKYYRMVYKEFNELCYPIRLITSPAPYSDVYDFIRIECPRITYKNETWKPNSNCPAGTLDKWSYSISNKIYTSEEIRLEYEVWLSNLTNYFKKKIMSFKSEDY